MPNSCSGTKKAGEWDLESENEANEEVEGKDQELKIKIEEIITLMKEMNRGQRDEVKAREGEAQNIVHEVSHSSEPEKMLQDYTEAATEELSRKKNDLSELREKNTMIETQRKQQKSGETQEDVEKIKKKKKQEI